MPVTITSLERVFRFQGTEIPDPSPKESPERCLEILALAYPQFNNALIELPSNEGGKQVFNIKVAVGEKG